MSSREIFAVKAVSETLKLSFDFTSSMAVTETITARGVAATVYSGVDLTPSSIISGVATVSGKIVSQVITGGTAGVQYLLNCGATTSAGQILVITAYLTVESG